MPGRGNAGAGRGGHNPWLTASFGRIKKLNIPQTGKERTRMKFDLMGTAHLTTSTEAIEPVKIFDNMAVIGTAG